MKKTNKDTIKAIDAATILIKYCARYKHCKGCIFNVPYCAINKPYTYTEINEGGAHE